MVISSTGDHLNAIVPLKNSRTVSISFCFSGTCSVATEEQEGVFETRAVDADTIGISKWGIPLLTYTCDNIDAVVQFFYTTLEVVAEAVSESMTSTVVSIVLLRW